METPQRRFFLALLIPVGVLAFMATLIGGLGVLLLALSGVQEKLLGVHEPYAVVGALIISAGILGGAALVARRVPRASG
jgi:hypothetical protein